MKTYRSILLLFIAALATASFAQTKPGTKADTRPPSTLQKTDLDNILTILTQTQNEVRALEAAVASLAANQKDQAAQTSVLLKDVARRVYATCVLTATNEHDCARRLERECSLLISRPHHPL